MSVPAKDRERVSVRTLSCSGQKFRVFVKEEGGGFVASCPSLPGCVEQGRSLEGACESLREAIEGYLASLQEHGGSNIVPN